MYFFRESFFDGPWTAYGVCGYDYRISVQRATDARADLSYWDGWEAEHMMRDVTFFALASSHVVDRELIDALLEIHHAVHFNVEHPRAGDLLRAHRGRDYLDRVAEELRWAVRAGRLHIERLEPPSLLDIPMKAEEPHGSNAPDDVESPPYDEQIVFKDARAEPIEGRLRYRITNQADPQQLREGDSPSQGEVERFSTSVAQSLARAFRYAKFKFEE